jgi:predicted transcriptional regulator
MLRRHLATGHELTVEQYRARWKLPALGYSSRGRVWQKSLALVAAVGHPAGSLNP